MNPVEKNGPPFPKTNGPDSPMAMLPEALTVLAQPTFSYERPCDLLMPNPDPRDRTTAEYREYRDTVLRPDIRVRGIQVPLLAYLENLRKRIFDGGTRLEGALLEGLPKIAVLTYPSMPEPNQRGIASWLANENRLDWTSAERARFYRQTLQMNGWTPAVMCRQIPGLKPARLSKALKWLDKLLPEFHDKVGEGEGMIAERGAYTLADYDAVRQKELGEKMIAGLLTVEALEDMRAREKGGVKHQKPLKVKTNGIELVAKHPTIESILKFAEDLVSGCKKLLKDGDGVEYLPSRVKPA
jgi:ParB-like chromosome segregation protein Spo0J